MMSANIGNMRVCEGSTFFQTPGCGRGCGRDSPPHPLAIFVFPDSGLPLRFLRSRPPSVVAVEIFNCISVAVLQVSFLSK